MTESKRKYGLIPDAPDARDKIFNNEPLGSAAEKGNLSKMPEDSKNQSAAKNQS